MHHHGMGRGFPMMSPFGPPQMFIPFSGPKLWELQYEPKIGQIKSFGPFGTQEITFFFNDRQYTQIFGDPLEETKGKCRIKRITDTKWSDLDEIGLLLLLDNMPSNNSIKQNELDIYIKSLYKSNYGLWAYRYGSFGGKVYGPKTIIEMRQIEWRKTNDNIFIKRVGEHGWYEGGDINLHVLFYHLNENKDFIPQMGIKHITDAVQRGHTAKLRPHFEYDEWEIIRLLMKAMRIEQYFEELKNYCQEQEVLSIITLFDNMLCDNLCRKFQIQITCEISLKIWKLLLMI